VQEVVYRTLERIGDTRQKSGGQISDAPLDVGDGCRRRSGGARQIPLAETQSGPPLADRFADQGCLVAHARFPSK